MTGVAVSDLTVDDLGVSWVPAGDDRGVASYQVVLNGFVMKEGVGGTRAVVPWLNDSGTEYLLTVRAVDAAGNVGPASRGIPLTRPEPDPSSSGPPSGPPTAPIAPDPTGTP